MLRKALEKELGEELSGKKDLIRGEVRGGPPFGRGTAVGRRGARRAGRPAGWRRGGRVRRGAPARQRARAGAASHPLPPLGALRAPAHAAAALGLTRRPASALFPRCLRPIQINAYLEKNPPA
jgi:hypothetical protein